MKSLRKPRTSFAGQPALAHAIGRAALRLGRKHGDLGLVRAAKGLLEKASAGSLNSEANLPRTRLRGVVSAAAGHWKTDARSFKEHPLSRRENPCDQ
jgi:hypothetical protein